MTEIYLGNPPQNIKTWIELHTPESQDQKVLQILRSKDVTDEGYVPTDTNQATEIKLYWNADKTINTISWKFWYNAGGEVVQLVDETRTGPTFGGTQYTYSSGMPENAAKTWYTGIDSDRASYPTFCVSEDQKYVIFSFSENFDCMDPQIPEHYWTPDRVPNTGNQYETGITQTVTTW